MHLCSILERGFVSKMSALNMAMNGNAYKMIEIKKVSGPVVPLR